MAVSCISARILHITCQEPYVLNQYLIPAGRIAIDGYKYVFFPVFGGSHSSTSIYLYFNHSFAFSHSSCFLFFGSQKSGTFAISLFLQWQTSSFSLPSLRAFSHPSLLLLPRPASTPLASALRLAMYLPLHDSLLGISCILRNRSLPMAMPA